MVGHACTARIAELAPPTETPDVMRDLGDLAPGFPVGAGSIGPRHGFLQMREIGTAVRIHGLMIANGEVVHADRHGAVVSPEAVIGGLYDGLERLFASERIVRDATARGPMDFVTFRQVSSDFEKARS